MGVTTSARPGRSRAFPPPVGSERSGQMTARASLPGDGDAETGRRGAFLEKASLRGADVRRAYLRVARLDGADLSGADLRDVEGLAQMQVDAAVCDRRTKLPEGFRSRAHDGG